MHTPPRVSTDLDVPVNARVVTGGVREFVTAIEERGFVLAGASTEGIAHRDQRRGSDSKRIAAGNSRQPEESRGIRRGTARRKRR